MNQSESPKEVSMPPTLEAVNMKREQTSLQDKQVISLLDRRRQLIDAQNQNEADLLFVGYHPPLEMPQPKRMTEDEWLQIWNKEGYDMYLTTGIKEKYQKLANAEKELAWTKGLLQQSRERALIQKENAKPVKKSSSKKK